MDLPLSDSEEAIRRRFEELFARESSPARVRSAEPLGFDRELWQQVVTCGGIAAAIADPGRGLVELALVAESAGRTLAPVPFVDCAVATRILARVGANGARGWLAAAREKGAVVALALSPAAEGVARFVPAGAVADAVVALDGDELVLVSLAGTERPTTANLGSGPLAHCPVEGPERTVLARGSSALALYERGLDEWRVLTAAALVGLAAEALARGVEYVRRREQFGVAIGSFQTVQHRLADIATDVDGARLLAYEAAWSRDEDQADAAELASMAYLFSAAVAQRSASESLHFHGGYGFTLEYDIQLYYRRAKSWALVLDDPRRELGRLADRLFGPAESRTCISA